MGNFFGSDKSEAELYNSPIDIIIYTASLASDPRAVDATLDELRTITAQLKPGDAPSVDNVKKMRAIYFDLENYLTHREPLRTLNPVTIQEKVSEKFLLGQQKMEDYWQQVEQHADKKLELKPPSPEKLQAIRSLKRTGTIVIWGSLALGALSLLVPATESPEMPLSNNFSLAFSVAAVLMLFGGAMLFLKALPGFTPRLKTIYKLLCIGMISLALAQSQQVIYTYFELWDNPFIQNGGVAIGFVPMTVLFYMAMYKFARLLNVKTFASSFLAFVGISIVIGTASAFLPIPSPLPPEALRAALPPTLVQAATLCFAALMALSIKKRVTPAYTKALAWLALGLMVIASTALLYGLIQIFLERDNFIVVYGGISLLFAGAGILLVRSAVAFNLITEN